MGTALLWIAVLGFTQLSDINCGVVSENSPAKDVYSSAEEQRIIGGQKACWGQFPFIFCISPVRQELETVGALHFTDSFVCTCSILSPTTLLTAAHCVVLFGQQQNASHFHVIYASTNRSSATRRVNITSITVHDNYTQETLYGDIAILRTSSRIQRDKYAKPICLMRKWSSTCQDCTAAGWGLTKEGTPPPEDLYFVGLKPSTLAACQQIYGQFVTKCHVCMESPNKTSEKGICQGDSGGPLFCDVPKKGRLQAGVASYVSRKHGCGAKIPGNSVYTYVSCYIDWIVEKTKDSDICIR